MPESNTPALWPAYARVPPFLPVPLRARRGGWTHRKQAALIGFLAETGCIAEAARRVGMSRVAAYQLRKRAGAEGFAHAWDAVLAIRAAAAGEGAPLPKRNFTPDERAEAGMEGAIGVLMRRGRFVRGQRRICVNSLIYHANRLDAAARRHGHDWYRAMDAEADR